MSATDSRRQALLKDALELIARMTPDQLTEALLWTENKTPSHSQADQSALRETR